VAQKDQLAKAQDLTFTNNQMKVFDLSFAIVK